MAFVVETGAGVANANAYCSLAFADAYFADRNETAWTGSDNEKQYAIVRATDYVDLRFSSAFIGESVSELQALSWPRKNTKLYDKAVPVKLQRAVAEYALRALTAKLAPDPVISDTGFSVVTTKEVVGPIEQSYEIAGGNFKSQPNLIRPYPTADYLLVSLLKASKSVIR